MEIWKHVAYLLADWPNLLPCDRLLARYWCCKVQSQAPSSALT